MWNALMPGRRFGAEEKLLTCATAGSNCKVSGLDWHRDIEQLRTETQYCISGDFVRELAFRASAEHKIHPSGIQIEGAFISGDIDLKGAELVSRLALVNCYIDGKIFLEDAHGGILYLPGCRVATIVANRSKFTGSVFLQDQFECEGEARFFGAEIGGSLQCSASKFKGQGGSALDCTNARISGNVDLSRSKAHGLIWFDGAEIGRSLTCTDGIFLRRHSNKRGSAFSARRAQIKGDLKLDGKFRAHGTVLLNSAEIGGALICSGGSFGVLTRDALDRTGAKIAGNAYFDRGFGATGRVTLYGATVGGSLVCTKGRFFGHDGSALDCSSADIARGVFLDDDSTFTGQVSFTWAEIGRGLICSGGKFHNAEGSAFVANGAKITNDLRLDNLVENDRTVQFIATGPVALDGITIGGDLSCSGGWFTYEGHQDKNQTTPDPKSAGPRLALFLTSAKVGGNVYLRDEFRAGGSVSLYGAEIGGNLECSRAELHNPGGEALVCDAASITGAVLLDDGFIAEGRVSLRGAKIGDNLQCVNGHFTNGAAEALTADIATIAGGILLTNGFDADGEVRFVNAKIGSQMACTGGKFRCIREQPDGKAVAGIALNLESARIDDVLFLGKEREEDNPMRVEGSIDLHNAHAGALCDDEASWPPEYTAAGHHRCQIILDGFTYNRLVGGPSGWKERMRWLKLQPDGHLRGNFRSQPFEQLAKTLRDVGCEDDARRIGTEKHRRLWHQRTRRAFGWYPPVGWLLGLIIGLVGFLFGLVSQYGYSVSRVFGTLVGVLVLCSVFYGLAWKNNVFVPIDPRIKVAGKSHQSCNDAGSICVDAPGFVHFNQWLYSADVLLPAPNLKQKTTWAPRSENFNNAPLRDPPKLLSRTTQAVIAVEGAAGAILMVLLGAILSGLLKRD